MAQAQPSFLCSLIADNALLTPRLIADNALLAPRLIADNAPITPPPLAPLGESDFWTPMGSIGPQKSGRVDRSRRFLQPGRAG